VSCMLVWNMDGKISLVVFFRIGEERRWECLFCSNGEEGSVQDNLSYTVIGVVMVSYILEGRGFIKNNTLISTVKLSTLLE
jgi:hypothetical protein